MKGMVFTHFLDFVTEKFGPEMADDIIEANELPSGGAYTSVGTYSHTEMVAMVGTLAERTGVPADALVRAFGDRLSDTFAHDFPDFYRRATNLFDFLESIEAHIHIEVRKLYPDAELPTFRTESRTPSRLVLRYTSPRRMGHLSEGLISGSARQFGVEVRVHAESLAETDGLDVRFTIDLA
ncbi:MAG: heme NO-binding domain-containing protein [Gemmatimonadaceae bacterium]